MGYDNSVENVDIVVRLGWYESLECLFEIFVLKYDIWNMRLKI